ncbi:hypothetical protein G6F35_017344 [Rhizopus arrhizus]|nr:hypothetical protein G6F35_017344 [Rhizopus arrhizus]
MLAADRLGGDHGACRHRHLRGRRFHKPALAAVGRAGVQLAGHGDAVIDHVAQQHDLAVLAGGQRLGLRDAGVVDDGAGQIARGLGRQVDHATVGANGAALSSLTRLPAPSRTLPLSAVRLPVLVILAAISAMLPPGAAVMLPWLMMALLLAPSNL